MKLEARPFSKSREDKLGEDLEESVRVPAVENNFGANGHAASESPSSSTLASVDDLDTLIVSIAASSIDLAGDGSEGVKGAEEVGFGLDSLLDHGRQGDGLDSDDVVRIYVGSTGNNCCSPSSRLRRDSVNGERVVGLAFEPSRVVVWEVRVDSARVVVGEVKEIILKRFVVEILEPVLARGTDDEVLDVKGIERGDDRQDLGESGRVGAFGGRVEDVTGVSFARRDMKL